MSIKQIFEHRWMGRMEKALMRHYLKNQDSNVHIHVCNTNTNNRYGSNNGSNNNNDNTNNRYGNR